MRVGGFISLLFIVITLSCLAYDISAQADDRLWSSLRIRKQINTNTRLDVRPIVRYDQDISHYRNSSLDIALHRKLKKGMFMQFSSRTFIVPDAPNVQFLWADFGHVFKNSQIIFTNRVRMHYALDLGDTKQRDFIRYLSSLTPVVSWKVKPIFAIEPWFQLDGINKVTRVRYQLGLLSPRLGRYNISAWYWRQDSANEVPATSQNIYVVTMTYNLD